MHCYEDLEKQPEVITTGGSCIVNPYGEYVVEPVYNKEEILIGDLDLGQIIQTGGMDFDVMGHYSRPDIFELIVHEK